MLAIINAEMDKIGVPYEFMQWTAEVQGAYFVGEYSESESVSEDGYEESTMILTGTTRGSWAELEEYKQKIKRHFPNPYGLRMHTDDGAVAIFYQHSFPVQTGEEDLKRIQINLQIKKWRGK